MLDFLNLSKSGFMCELCRGNIKGENCVPQSCTHMFHVGCLEDWASEFDSSLEFACPVPGCSSSFSDILVRKTPGAINFTITSLKGNQCPICCERIQKPVATPESCNHAFCYMCLKEWSRVRHECPLDRGAYELILLSDRVGGPITKRVSAPPVKQQPPETPPLELDTNCEICQRPDDEAHLLLCDHCDRGYHTYCLPTPLSSIPDGDWFCPDCLRHGVVRPEAAAANASDRRVRRNIRRRLIDSEAEESDNDELTTTIDDSSSENLHLRRELSFTAQRRLEQQAMRRHRGRQLLQDLIEDLSERATSEASIRARRRNSQRQRVRNQLASESANLDSSGPSHVSQTTICFEISSSTNQPVSFRLGRATNNSSSNNRNHNCNTVQAECGGYSSSTNQLEVSRRRLRILSSSDSESDDPNGVVLRRVKLTSKRPRLIRSPSGESDSEGSSRITGPSSTLNTNWLAESDSDVQTNSVSRKNGEQKSTTSQSSFTSSIQNSTSENIQHEYDSKHSDFAESYAPAVKRTQRKRKLSRKKPRKRQSNKMKMRRRTKKISVKSKSLRYSRKKIIRKKMARLSVSLSSNSPRPSTSSQPRLRNGVIRTGLPKLSILGKETQCNFRLIVDEDNDDGSIRSRPSAPFSNAANSVSATSITQSNTKSSYLSEIEAGQASLFHFSTRHMQVNSDHSMSPIPVAKHSSSTIKTNQMNAINTNGNPVSLNNSSLTKHSTDNLSLVPKPPTFLNSRTNVLVSSSNNKCQSVSVSTAPIPSTSRTYPNETGSSNGSWSLEAINRVKSILKHHLKAYVSSHRIDKETCRDIFQRSWAKIIRKPAHKVSDERIAKLVDDYVQYFLKHKT